MHSRRTTIGCLLLLMLLTIPVWAPLTRPGLPAWRAGALPALAVSAGPLDAALLPARLLHAAGLGNADALKISLILGVFLAALSLFFGIRRLWGERAGVLAALLALYSPIFLSALYIEGAAASVWLMVGASSLVWNTGERSWRKSLIIILGLPLTIATLFKTSPQPPLAFFRLFEAPWYWQTQTVDLRTPFSWSPGLALLIMAFISLWRLGAHRSLAAKKERRLIWEFLLTALLLVGVAFLAGEYQAAFLLMSVMPLTAIAVYLLRLFSDLQKPALWAALLLTPILGAGPALSPEFVDVTIPEHPAAIFGDQQILLIDVSLNGVLAPGQTVTVNATWQALKPIDFDYNIFIHIIDDAGNAVAQFDGQPQGGDRPMTSWIPGEIIPDAYAIAIPADAPASLHVQMGLYNWQTLERLPLAAGGDILMIKEQ